MATPSTGPSQGPARPASAAPANAGDATPKIDLGELASAGHRYELVLGNGERTEELQARLAKEKADGDQRRLFNLILLIFALIVTGTVFVGAVYVFATGSAEDKKWAAGLVSAIVSGLVGYLVGQGKK
ncbi:hypothetical protein [Burkholderia glumae]|uniref:hypothetical protein n=1 Tax=Burkholderia glumae TaxID=337 RepID=UPI002036CD8D|nr:hypothetical protein [Burkholderia glumae]MCM2496040.1 hypothetical protein [Burkholderia glumae]